MKKKICLVRSRLYIREPATSVKGGDEEKSAGDRAKKVSAICPQ
jgi:hypothetical protein